MVYRMKRNGAGLASICILSTMVLVMMMGAGSLYAGTEDSLSTRYPYQISVTTDFLTGEEGKLYSQEKAAFFLDQMDGVLESYGVVPENGEQLFSSSVTGILKNGELILDPHTVGTADGELLNSVAQIYLVPLASYNQYMGTEKTIEEGEVLLYCIRRTYDSDTITLHDGTVLTVKEQLPDIMGKGDAAMQIIPAVFIVTDNMETMIEHFNEELGACQMPFEIELQL